MSFKRYFFFSVIMTNIVESDKSKMKKGNNDIL